MTTTTLPSRFSRAVSRIVVALFAVGTVAGAVGCAADVDDARTSPTMTLAPTAEGSSQQVSLVGGGMLDLADMSDQPLALWFWAPG